MAGWEEEKEEKKEKGEEQHTRRRGYAVAVQEGGWNY